MFLPARVLSWSGIVRPVSLGAAQVAGVVVGASGAVLALWCIVTFIVIGRGTPAPFDPPRRLVVVGPYRLVRNPMYVGAGLALAGAALFYESWALLGYGAAMIRFRKTSLRRGIGCTQSSAVRNPLQDSSTVTFTTTMFYLILIAAG